MREIYSLLLVMAAVTSMAAQTRPTDLRCEGMREPLGIDNVKPCFSWKLEAQAHFPQTAFEIEVASDRNLLVAGRADIWKSGRVETDESVMLPYEGKALMPRKLYYWRVKYHSGERSSEWSEVNRFSIGIVSPERMRGCYIGLGKGQEKAVLLSRTFDLQEEGQAALLHVNSLGYHEAYLNGRKVSEAILSPAVSQMNKRSLIVTYDITPLLRKGENTLVLWIGSGWYKKETFGAGYNGPAVRVDADILIDGVWHPLVQTDSIWQGRESGYEDTGSWKPDAFGGERIDARIAPSDFSVGNLGNHRWMAVETVEIDSISASPQMCQLNTIRETIPAASMEYLGAGKWLIDMGRVLNGLFEIQLPPLPEGHEVRATYTDHLSQDGGFGLQRGEDVFIASGKADGDSFKNRFNHHCFRYVMLSGLPRRPDLQKMKAHRIGMDVDKTGTFSSSDADLNAIYQMLDHTMDCLTFGGYMVDCVSIERLGYGGDGNASTLSLQNMYDVAPLYMNWLQAWNDAIRSDGGLPHTAPNPYVAGGGPYWCTFIIQAPWHTWWNYGDDRLLHRCYENMKLWLRYVDAHTEEGLLHEWPNTIYRYWYLGDWLAPKGVDVKNKESIDLVNNCALSQSYAKLEQIAQKLGYEADRQNYANRRLALNKRIHETFFHPESQTYATGSQLDMVYPLLVKAVPNEYEQAVKDLLKKNYDRIGVGLVGIPVFTEWVTRSHEVDYMYKMLKREDYPGYLYMLRHGATGTWEDWDNPRSHLHNCFNGIGSWFIQALGGIVPTMPGYKTVSIEPQIPQGLDWVRVTRDTPYGTILVYWRQKDGHGIVHVEIPHGITAVVNGETVGGGVYDYHIR